jgi:hypothetical protein
MRTDWSHYAGKQAKNMALYQMNARINQKRSAWLSFMTSTKKHLRDGQLLLK